MYRILASNHDFMNKATYPNFPWRNFVSNTLNLSHYNFENPSLQSQRDVVDSTELTKIWNEKSFAPFKLSTRYSKNNEEINQEESEEEESEEDEITEDNDIEQEVSVLPLQTDEDNMEIG